VLRRFKELPEVSCQHALSLLKAANDAVIAEKTSGSTRDDMHATAALLLLDRSCERAVLAHVGDSRIYHFRRAGLLSRTCDHSLVQQMVDAGYGNAELLRTHPKRNLLTSAIGAAGAIEMTVSPHPIEVSPGDCLLLCSDGWWEYLQDAEMELALSRTKAGVDWLDEMATTIRRRGKAGHDNYSALCVSVRDELTVLLDPAKVMTLPFQPRE
jgi:PPM family protein phosphatase